MSEIDWSKAPDWADSVWLGALSGLAYWVHAGTERTQRIHDGFIGAVFDREVWNKVCERPAETAWSGDGLPPVGTVCEVMGKREGCEWVECCIVAHDGDLAVYRTQDGRYDADMALFENNPQRRLFRPIRTEAQIEAEERQKAIDEIAALLGWDKKFDGTQRDAGKLYDAGYRKQEPKP